MAKGTDNQATKRPRPQSQHSAIKQPQPKGATFDDAPGRFSAATRDLNEPDERKRRIYEAFAACDTRLDGQVFVGVLSTGIYCRPVCHAPMPKYENCTFFATAAEAEAAGYRPCLLCRAEQAPGMSTADATKNLARRAAFLLREECTSGQSVDALAGRLGYTDRHLRRAFKDEFNLTPVQYLQTCRLLLAKALLTDTDLPVSQVAAASGFKSTRRFNDVFKQRYRLTPSSLRKDAKAKGAVAKGSVANPPALDGITIRLDYRPPYRFDELLGFLRDRALEGVEVVDDRSYARVARMPGPEGEAFGWVRVAKSRHPNALDVTLSDSLLPMTSQVIARVRNLFDIDANPETVYRTIKSLDDMVPGPSVAGTRVPGCFDPFETAVRAIIGQQITVVAANRIAARVVSALGTPVSTGIPGLTTAFPTPADLLAQGPLEERLGPLGVIRSRSRTIAELARALRSGDLRLEPGVSAAEQMERLLAIKGIGPWSANYIVMRTLGYSDAFMETDAGVAHALPDLDAKGRRAIAEQWRPWRSYANAALWYSLAWNRAEDTKGAPS